MQARPGAHRVARDVARADSAPIHARSPRPAPAPLRPRPRNATRVRVPYYGSYTEADPAKIAAESTSRTTTYWKVPSRVRSRNCASRRQGRA